MARYGNAPMPGVLAQEEPRGILAGIGQGGILNGIQNLRNRQPGQRPILDMLGNNAQALWQASIGSLMAPTRKMAAQAWQQGYGQGSQVDAYRNKETADQRRRQQQEQALASVWQSLEQQGKVPAGMEGLAGLPEIAAPLIANALKPPEPVDQWVDATVNGMPGQRNNRTNQFDPFPTQAGAQPTPYSDPAKLRRDLDNGLITPEQYQQGLADAGKPDAGEQFDNEAKLRDGYVKASTVFVDSRRAFSRIQASIGDNTGASDVALVFSFMRLLDPASTVREGEFATAEQTGGLPAQVVNMYNRLVDGQRLTPDQRQNFLQQAQRQYTAAEAQQAELDNTYRTLAEQYGYDPQRVVIDVRGGVKAGNPAQQTIQSARDAIAQGADREAVRQRLIENGIQPPGDL